MAVRHLSVKSLRFSLAKHEGTLCVLGNLRKSSTASEASLSHSPEYPQILDLTPEEQYKRERNEKLDKVRKVGTIEEKLIGINMPRYYGWSSLILKEGSYPFNFMPFIQHITRTDFIEASLFPFTNNYSDSEIKNFTSKVRPQLQDAILMELLKKRHLFEFDGSKEKMGDGELSDAITKGVVEQINRVLCANLASAATHLYDTEIDFDPRIEAFWRVGGFYPDNETYKERVKDKEDYEKEKKKNHHAKRKNEEEPEDLIGHFIQYIGTPLLQLRHPHPLRPLELQQPTGPSRPDSEVAEAIREPDLKHVPVLRYDPGFYGLEKIRRHGTNIPGFWPGDKSEFGLLSYHGRGHLLGRPPSFGGEDLQHTVHAQAMLAGYAWMLAQAAYQGFSTFLPLKHTKIFQILTKFKFFSRKQNFIMIPINTISKLARSRSQISIATKTFVTSTSRKQSQCGNVDGLDEGCEKKQPNENRPENKDKIGANKQRQIKVNFDFDVLEKNKQGEGSSCGPIPKLDTGEQNTTEISKKSGQVKEKVDQIKTPKGSQCPSYADGKKLNETKLKQDVSLPCSEIRVSKQEGNPHTRSDYCGPADSSKKDIFKESSKDSDNPLKEPCKPKTSPVVNQWDSEPKCGDPCKALSDPSKPKTSVLSDSDCEPKRDDPCNPKIPVIDLKREDPCKDSIKDPCDDPCKDSCEDPCKDPCEDPCKGPREKEIEIPELSPWCEKAAAIDCLKKIKELEKEWKAVVDAQKGDISKQKCKNHWWNFFSRKGPKRSNMIYIVLITILAGVAYYTYAGDLDLEELFMDDEGSNQDSGDDEE